MPSSIHHDDRVRLGAALPTPDSGGLKQRYAKLMAFALIGVATTGYFLGLTAPMPTSSEQTFAADEASEIGEHRPSSSVVIPATVYSEMRFSVTGSVGQRATRLNMLHQPPYDVNAKIVVNKLEKLASLANRATRRAYDGAPPTVPHPVDQLDSASCMACHGEGLRTDSLRAGKIPHPFYASCTQCHVEQQASFATASATYENSFAGVAAPSNGGRAAPGASPVVPHTTWMREALENRDPAADWVPPVVPHTTWMRDDCLSCHGRTAAPGMESSHPWRAHCLQCHGESLQRNQAMPSNVSDFSPSPVIKKWP
ncbi:hypothetical protein OAS39_06925 [Pirellulales bacterium]|nr:hypothetical protein [Pirellulales bacterium]